MKLLLALLGLNGVAARSAGIFQAADVNLGGCDFDTSTTLWGCQSNSWNYTTQVTPTPSRTMCFDSDGNRGPKFMWWTSPPQNAPAGTFSLRSGDAAPSADPTTYPPGGVMSIYIRVLKFNTLYKGLLLYAKNTNNTKVGQWEVPFDIAPQFGNDQMHKCNRSVMHISAEDKPYVQKFTFLAPPAGTGNIAIRAMLKTGPPNPTDWGAFLRLPNLNLAEGTRVPVNNMWYPLPVGQSCSEFCTMNNLEGCDPNALGSNLDGTPALDQTYACNSAMFTTCTGNPGVDLTTPGKFCRYRNASCPSGASCSAVSDASQTLFCVCGKYTYNPPPISASPRAVPGFVTAVLALLTTWSFGRFKLGGLVFLGVALMSATPAQAHNWMEGTRGRAHLLGASQFCSPTFPQLSRNTIHMQVNPAQEFVVEWAAAHTDYTYFVIVHDSDSAKVPLLTRSLMDAWLAGCTTSNFANDTTTPYTKLHRFGANFNVSSQEPVSTGSTASYGQFFRWPPLWSGPIWNKFSDTASDRPATFYMRNTAFNSPQTQAGMYNDLYILPFNTSNYPRTQLAQYEDAYMVNDRRCYSSNHNATWIEGIVRFQHHDVGRALATAIMHIPAKKGPGRYQVHYKWSSYCDVMDVDVQPASNPVINPYGNFTPANATVYDMGHHCWIEKPQVTGQCVEVVTNTAQCAALCNLDGNCRGYQLLPLQLNPTVSGNLWGQFSASSFIPWDMNNTRCNVTQFQNKNIPALGAMACFTILRFQDDFNSARPLWEFTRDMDHQGFYGTCYIKPRAVTYQYPTLQLVQPVDNTFQFLSKCLPCDNLGQNFSEPNYAPRWGPNNQLSCVDCRTNPAPVRRLTIPSWTLIGAGTFRDAAHWVSPGGTPYANSDECKIVAARDPTCSKFVMFSQSRATQAITNWRFNNTFSLMSTQARPGYPYPGYYFTNSSFTFSAFRTCACLDATPANAMAGYSPNIDATSYTMACAGISNATCVNRGFSVYQLN